MKRRDCLKFLGGAAAWPLAAHAQQPQRVRRIGVLMNFAETDTATQQYLGQFKRGLAAAGWVEGQNLAIDYRWNVTHASRAKTYAAELLQHQPEVILSSGSVAMDALRDPSRTIPVVFVLVTDPVAQGFVANLPRPGGNTTGFSSLELSLGGKWLEVLRDLVPELARVSVIFAPEVNSYASFLIRPMQELEPSVKVTTSAAPVRTEQDIETAMGALAGEGGAFVVLQDAFTVAKRRTVVGAANRSRVRGIYPTPVFVRDGGLVSYGPDLSDQFLRAASYVDRILGGAKVGDLPVQQPVKFQLVLNLKTAHVLGATVPPTLLARADEVIE
jgi:putative tryptophan/tyrosine transport system substrate-binding protein